ncbi:MAG: ATP-grasp domain-containing protein [bacterium]|nr:ATP-grasp domain-containing protein [bacterium]
MIVRPARILIVNRGEIAIRVARAVRELGHIAVGLWTDNEPGAAHLAYCDEWVHLEGHGHAETYLNISRLIELARRHDITAVHPGYGFLAENDGFAEALDREGLVFVGPNARAIRMMGDKAVSKRVARQAGVPTIPGSLGAVADLAEALAIAGEIAYPVLLKAVAGGGGRGMRICRDAREVEANFEAVQREARAAFGNGDLLVEKYIVNPRHVEVQILADKAGNVRHLFERECSIQRRHQKIIEEAPSPFIGDNEPLRLDICATAVKLARAVGYDSAGTVEFVMGEDRSYYFLEMNTRIQVEHPITEEITGIDLVACMIQAALGQPVDAPPQEAITHRGHAIECRICAEDPVTLAPTPGTVTGLATAFPQGTRFDHCLYEGLEVTPDFDPMVGKLVTRGMSRAVAVRKMHAALDGLAITGLVTNIPLHKQILADGAFIAGKYSTDFIEARRPQDGIQTQADLETIYRQLASIEAANMGL